MSEKIYMSADNLPDDLAGLLRLGIESMDGLDRSEYVPDTSVMLFDGASGGSKLTLSGAVLAARGDILAADDYHWADITGPGGVDVYEKLRALDCLSVGAVDDALFIQGETTMDECDKEDYERARASHDLRAASLSAGEKAVLSKWPEAMRGARGFAGWSQYDRWRERGVALAAELEAFS